MRSNEGARWQRSVRAYLLLGIVVALGAPGANAASIEASWTGVEGDYEEPASWDFSTPPASALFPSNDGTDFFDVLVDAGLLPTASVVTLRSAATIDRLAVDAGDALVVDDAASLTISASLDRPGSGAIENHGTIRFDGAASGSGASLLADGALEISGTGALVMSDASGNRIGSASVSPISLLHSADHTIRGAGTIEAGTLTNLGTIEATGANALSIDGQVENEGLMRATGAGGFVLSDAFVNRGVIEVEAGSRLVESSAYGSSNWGTLRITGLGTTANMQLDNYGLVEVLDGAVFETSGRFHQSSPDAVTRIANGAEFVVSGTTNMIVSWGTLILDSATFRSTRPLSLGINSSALVGNGSLIFSDPYGLSVSSSGVVSPGLSGPGLIDITGYLGISGQGRSYSGGRIQAEIAGLAPTQFDRVRVSGSATLNHGAFVEVSLIDGFVPEVGDSFDLLEAASISVASPSLSSLFKVDAIDGSHFFTPLIVSDAGGESLRLGVAELITATWRGGGGDYSDASRWGFSTPPQSASIPDNDAASIFDVLIDGGGDDISSTAALSAGVSIGHLAVDDDDTLAISGTGSLTLAKVLGRQENGRVDNAGRMLVSAGGALLTEADLEITGGGALELTDDAANRLGAVGTTPIDMLHGAGHIIRGSGTLALNPGTGKGTLTNEGEINANGANALRIEGEVMNLGTLRVSGTGGLEITEGVRQSGPDSLTHIGSDSELRVLDGPLSIAGGRLVLEGGTVWASDWLSILDSARIEGIGTIVVPDGFSFPFPPSLRMYTGGVLAPGLDGPGLLDVDGMLVSRGGSFEVEIGGTLPEQFDRLHVSDEVTLNGGQFSVEFVEGFTPALGDRFEILTGASITPSAPLATLFAPVDMGGRFFAAGIVPNASGEGLELSVVELIEASWTGGVSSYEDPSLWSFSAPTQSASIPDNDELNVFDVRVDAGQPGIPSILVLNQGATIDTLFVDAGDQFALADGARLILADTAGRAQTGRIANDGVISVVSTGAPTQILADGNLEIDGSGALILSDFAENRVGAAGDFSVRLEHGEGHTISGAGTIDIGLLSNRGTIEAIGDNPLLIDGDVDNEGVLMANGSGGMRFTGILTNHGTVEVGNGSSLSGSSPLSFFDRVYVQTGADSLTRIGSGGELTLQQPGGLFIEGGRLVLDDALVRAYSLEAQSARVEGSGKLAIFEVDLLPGSSLAPGLAGVGELELSGSLALHEGAALEIELGGTAAGSEHDLVTMLGTSFLDGAMLVDLIAPPGSPGDAFAPTLGNTFDVVLASQILADALDVQLPGLGGDLRWLVEVIQAGAGEALRLRVVPEPGTGFLVLLGLIALGRPRRRSQ